MKELFRALLPFVLWICLHPSIIYGFQSFHFHHFPQKIHSISNFQRNCKVGKKDIAVKISYEKHLSLPEVLEVLRNKPIKKSSYDTILASLSSLSTKNFYSLSSDELLELLQSLLDHRLYTNTHPLIRTFFDHLIEYLHTEYSSFSPLAMTQILVKIPLSRMHWKFLSLKQKQDLLEVFEWLNAQGFPTFTDFSQFAFIISEFSCSWKELSRPVQTFFLRKIMEYGNSPSLAKYDFTAILDVVSSFIKLQIAQFDSQRYNDIQTVKREMVKELLQRISDQSLNLSLEDVKIHALLSGMVQTGYIVDQLNQKTLTILLQLTNQSWSQLDLYEQALVILRLGELGVKKDIIPSSLKERMFMRLIKQEGNLVIRHIPSIIKGFVGMGYQWDDLPADFRDSLLRAIIRNFQLLSTRASSSQTGEARNIAYSIHGLGLLGMKWSYFPENDQAMILRTIGMFSSSYIIIGINMILESLGRMGAEWNSLSAEFRSSFSDAIVSLWKKNSNDRFTEKDLVSFMKGCYILQFSWYNYQSSSLASSSKATLPLREKMFKIMEFWYYQPSEDKRHSQRSNQKKDSDAHGFARIIYWLGRSGMQWESDLSKTTKIALINGIESYCQSKEVSDGYLRNLLYGLALSRATFENLGYSITKRLEKALKTCLSTVSVSMPSASIQLSSSLNSLSSPPSPPSLNQQAVSIILYSLGLMQGEWQQFSSSTHQILVEMVKITIDSFPNQELSNTMYGMSLLSFDVCDVEKDPNLFTIHQLLLNRFNRLTNYSLSLAIEKGGKIEEETVFQSSSFNLEDKRQIAGYFEMLRILPEKVLSRLLLRSLEPLKGKEETLDVPASIVWRHVLPRIPCDSSSYRIISKTHLRFSKQLLTRLQQILSPEDQKMITIEDEYYGLPTYIFPVDIAISFKGKILEFIEIDGESHYYLGSSPFEEKDKENEKKSNDSKRNTSIIKRFDRKDQLKETLYGYYYPNTPIWRYEVEDIQKNTNERVEEVSQRIKQALVELKKEGITKQKNAGKKQMSKRKREETL